MLFFFVAYVMGRITKEKKIMLWNQTLTRKSMLLLSVGGIRRFWREFANEGKTTRRASPKNYPPKTPILFQLITTTYYYY
jgi:hypothetical protein